ncbi:hypothetical protein Goari_010484 [Gossypium aridum]|uniref:Retrotransposon gag domain-containing protein n=1 Tax=Gossypium aridum TaxID=34290 RepID=A0A7J8Y1Q7_GOSAI|nr:hypothetical protein [Gossypium aridum]
MKEQLWNFVLESLRSTMNKLTIMDDVLKAIVMTLKEKIAELKMELTIHKATLNNGMLALGLKQQRMDAPKPKEFKGTRSARDVDNFLWRMEQYFYAMGIKDDTNKVNNYSVYFTDVVLLWWIPKSTNEKCGGNAIGTWEEFQRELKKQFNPQYAEDEAWAKLSSLRNKLLFGTLAEVKSFVKLGLRKNKFETTKPKETGNGRGDHEEEQEKNDNAGNGKNGSNGRTPNGK